MKSRLFITAAGLAALAATASGATARPTAPQELCVGGSKPGCFSTIQAAVDAARDGDRIKVGPGTFAGGVTIDVSVKLTGAGAGATVIDGGGPVVTIGVQSADSEPTVTIKGVTITGGDNGSPASADPVFATGGGVYVSGSDAGGAVLTLADSVVTGNRAVPTATALVGPPCPGGPCPFAQGEGGGIANGGTLTLDHVTVSDNVAGGYLASDADAGGISNLFFATLTVKNSTITGNVARVEAPNGRFADAGGVKVRFGSTMTMENTVVSGNRVEGPLAEPDSVEANVIAGGIHLGFNAAATIRNATIEGNTVTGSNTVGEGFACAGGLMSNEGSTLDLRDSSVTGNHVTVMAVNASPNPGDSLGCSGGMDLSGLADIRNSRFTGNTLDASTTTGAMFAASGAISTIAEPGVTIRDSVVSGNSVSVSAPAGVATGIGGGIQNTGPLTLRNTTVSDNTITVSEPTALALGGGIFNGAAPGIDLPVELTLIDSMIVRNTLTGPAGSTLQGGGLFTDSPVAMKNTTIAQNSPDQCFGC